MTATDTFFATLSAGGSGVGELFADPFLFGDADGCRPVARAAFLAGLPARARMVAEAGLGRAELTGVDEHRLDDHYLLVRTAWAAPRPAGGDPVPLVSSFLLHDDGRGRLQAVAYLNHQGPPQRGA